MNVDALLGVNVCIASVPGSFLAVYCATTLLLGVPLALLEVGLGQLCEQGVTRVWRAVPLFTGENKTSYRATLESDARCP